MVTVEDCILGNSTLHDRFFITTEILAKLVSSAPRAVSIVQLEEATGRTAKELAKLCMALSRAGLLRHAEQGQDTWVLTREPSLVTLEDVFRCVTAGQQSRSRPAKGAHAEGVSNDVDLLVDQAMIAINQSVFNHLRRFSLDRLKISSTGMFPAPSRALRDPGHADDFNVTVSGREARFSPVQVPAQACSEVPSSR